MGYVLIDTENSRIIITIIIFFGTTKRSQVHCAISPNNLSRYRNCIETFPLHSASYPSSGSNHKFIEDPLPGLTKVLGAHKKPHKKGNPRPWAQVIIVGCNPPPSPSLKSSRSWNWFMGRKPLRKRKQRATIFSKIYVHVTGRSSE